MQVLIEIILVTILLYFFDRNGGFLALKKQNLAVYMMLIMAIVISPSFTLIMAAHSFMLGDLVENIKEALKYDRQH